MKEYKSIKVPTWAYENEQLAKVYVARKGLNNLPKDVLEPTRCPVCKEKMQRFEATYEYLKCSNCNYVQQSFKAGGNFSGGIIIGLALALLFRELFKEKK